MEIFALATITCLVIVAIGYPINKYLRLPWMFTVVVFGMVLSALGLFQEVMDGANFQFLARMGMLFFLFTIGLDLEMDQIRKLGRYIVGGDLLLTLTEGTLLGLFLYLVFPEFVSHSILVALMCGIAFGTVGEVVLLAILKEFGLEKTRFGQLALGIGVFDDIFEILALAVIVVLPTFGTGGSSNTAWNESLAMVATLAGLVIVTLLLSRLGKVTRPYLAKLQNDSFVVPFLIFALLFAFVYFGATRFENMGIVAAIFAGVAVNQVLPEKFVQQYKKPVFFAGNIFLGPFFFLSLGGRMSFDSLLTYPLLILAIIAISLTSRLSVSYLLFNKILGKRESVIMGVGLTSKFSTSVISENILFSTGLIAQPLYSALMAAFIILKPIIVGVFARGLATTKDTIKQKYQAVVVETAAGE
ncbi:MAG TPA: cation:proton antiporter [Anaerolineae bacterium]|nr:cation:proton antiporter [Anaerolineae bacterium]